ncbi:MAG TPA: hypothetical protein VI585_19150 [Candidatus Binatia bacterium]
MALATVSGAPSHEPTGRRKEKTLVAAKKEGQVVLSMRRYEGVLAEFEKEYPEIKVVTITFQLLPNSKKYKISLPRFSLDFGEPAWYAPRR